MQRNEDTEEDEEEEEEEAWTAKVLYSRHTCWALRVKHFSGILFMNQKSIFP